MKVYLNGERASQAPTYQMFVNPGAHLGETELPAEWVTENNEPLTFPVTFTFGVAEVPDNLGRYLVKHGLAAKSKLIIPAGMKVA